VRVAASEEDQLLLIKVLKLDALGKNVIVAILVFFRVLFLFILPHLACAFVLRGRNIVFVVDFRIKLFFLFDNNFFIFRIHNKATVTYIPAAI
jgi:hypothetical protein